MGAAELEKNKIFCQQILFTQTEEMSVEAVTLLCILVCSLQGLDNFC